PTSCRGSRRRPRRRRPPGRARAPHRTSRTRRPAPGAPWPSRSSRRLLAGDAEPGPGDRLEAVSADGVPAALAGAVGALVELAERALDVGQAALPPADDRDGLPSLGRRVGAVGEPVLQLRDEVDGVGVDALFGDLPAEAVALVLEGPADPVDVDAHGFASSRRALGWDVTNTSR